MRSRIALLGVALATARGRELLFAPRECAAADCSVDARLTALADLTDGIAARDAAAIEAFISFRRTFNWCCQGAQPDPNARGAFEDAFAAMYVAYQSQTTWWNENNVLERVMPHLSKQMQAYWADLFKPPATMLGSEGSSAKVSFHAGDILCLAAIDKRDLATLPTLA